MRREMLYSFLGSSAFHLTALVVLLTLSKTAGKIKKSEIRFTKISFARHSDEKITAIMKKLGKMKKEGRPLFAISGKTASYAEEELAEIGPAKNSGGTRRSKIAPKIPKSSKRVRKTSFSPMPCVNKAPAGDLFIEDNSIAAAAAKGLKAGFGG